MGLSEFFFFFFFFLFFRRQGFRMITFDRQAGPLQNFNRSHIMVIGRSVSFSDPARPPGGGVGRPKHPKIPPPPKNKFLFACRFRTPGTFLKNLVGKKNWWFIVYMSYWNCWDYLLLHEDCGECSEDWAGACRWGGGGRWNFITKKISAKKCFFPTKIFFFKNVPGVLKRMQTKIYFSGGGGGIFGVFGAPHAPTPGVARGRKTIHFFLWPWHVTG